MAKRLSMKWVQEYLRLILGLFGLFCLVDGGPYRSNLGYAREANTFGRNSLDKVADDDGPDQVGHTT